MKAERISSNCAVWFEVGIDEGDQGTRKIFESSDINDCINVAKNHGGPCFIDTWAMDRNGGGPKQIEDGLYLTIY